MIYRYLYPLLGLKSAIRWGTMKKEYILLLTIFLFSGCLSVMEKAGQVLDGSAFKEKKVALYSRAGGISDIELTIVRNKNDEQSFIIDIKEYPMMKLRGSFPDEENNFYFTSLEYLGGNVHGWNEYSLDLLGSGILSLGQTAVLAITEEIEPIQISTGRIHRYDTRITGQEALTGLRNRRERILVLVEWMTSMDTTSFKDISDFEEYWKPILFPELVSAKLKPENWRQEGDTYARAEDILWNTSYTERVFSEILVPVRNSGTMLRDWEEASSWIYMEYKWEAIMDLFSKEIILTKIK